MTASYHDAERTSKNWHGVKICKAKVSKAARMEVLGGSDGECFYCKQFFMRLEIDHYVPRCFGGDNRISNLRPCCSACNIKKGTTLPKDVGPYADRVATIQRWLIANGYCPVHYLPMQQIGGWGEYVYEGLECAPFGCYNGCEVITLMIPGGTGDFAPRLWVLR